MLDERPDAVPERASHRHPFGCELARAERGVAVHLADDLLEVAERELPDRAAQLPERPLGQQLIALVHGIGVVAHRALAEQLRLPEVRIPARALDPASHHVVAARHQIGVVLRRSDDEDRQDLVAHLARAALVGIEAEDPVVTALRDRAVAQVAETVERDLHHPRAEALGDLGGAVGAAGIGHDDLVRPQHARHRVRDLLGFVVGEDVGRYLLHWLDRLTAARGTAFDLGKPCGSR